MILIDTHCHLDLEQFDADREAVLERAFLAGVSHILIPGLNIESSRQVIKLAASHPRLYAAVGVHPTEAGTWTTASCLELRYLLNPMDSSGILEPFKTSASSKIVAIGEIGLDYYWDTAPHETQQEILRQQLDLAARAGLPVILHMREAREKPDGSCARDLLNILEGWVEGLRSGKNPLAEHPGVLHSFSGTLETAEITIRLGFMIGVTGALTYKNAGKLQEIVSALPLEAILIETDAPFQTPHPYRGKRNEPAHVRLIADKIAVLHACSPESIAKRTSQNARRLFAWKETA